MDFKRLLFGKYDHLCKVEVIRESLEANFQKLAKKIPVAPVLKSNAYGHGLVLAASVFDRFSPPFMCVDSLYEAYELLKAGIKTPVLIMGHVPEANLRYKKLPFAFAAYNQESLLAIHKCQPQAPIHLFVDTGMHREGVLLADLPELAREIRRRGIELAGLMSHAARVGAQQEKFRQARAILAKEGIAPKWWHMGKSGNIARVGLELYLPKPALRLICQVVQVKEIQEGGKVGYDWTFTAKKEMTLAVLPVGYNEGVDRRLSNRGVVKVGKHFCPIVGRVSMNLISVDVTRVSRVKAGDEVVVISDQASDPNSVKNIAKVCGTIPYEILVHINPTLKRVLV